MSHKPYEVLAATLAEARAQVPVGAAYVLSKSQAVYEVKDHTILEATDEAAIVYQSLEHPEVSFTRRFLEWFELVEVEGEQVPRFRRLT